MKKTIFFIFLCFIVRMFWRSSFTVMLFFLSKQYFTSRNCLREVKATINEQLPLVLVHEQQEEKGGGMLGKRHSRGPYDPWVAPR